MLAAAAGALGATPLPVGAQGDALTLAEVIDLHRRGVSARRILQTAREYCIAFTVTDSIAQELAASGADSALVGGMRTSCVVRPPVQLPPGVLLFAAVDQLCTMRPDSGGMRVENRRRERGCGVSYPFQLDDAGVRVELTVARLDGEPGATVALAFGTSPSSAGQYTFSVTTHNRFELCTTVREQRRRLLYATRAGLVRAGTQAENRIAVRSRGARSTCT